MKLWFEGYKRTKKGIFCRTESVATTPKSRDHVPTTSLWRVAAKWPTRAPKTKLILCPRDPQGYNRISLSLPGRILKEYRYSMGFAKSHSLKRSLHKWAWRGAGRKKTTRSSRLNCIDLIHFRLTAGRLRGSSCIVIPVGSSANCYSSRQHSRPAWLTLLSTTCIHSLLKNLRWQPHWLPRLTSLPGSHVTDGEPETVVSASLQKIKSIKTPIKHFFYKKKI